MNRSEEFQINQKPSQSKCVAILNLIMMLIGIIANGLCVYSYVQKRMRKNKFNWYLLVLAKFELIFCFILFINDLTQLINSKSYYLHELNNYFGVLISSIIRTIDSYLVIITLYLSIDRLYAIRYPIDVKNFITNVHVKNLISITLVCFA